MTGQHATRFDRAVASSPTVAGWASLALGLPLLLRPGVGTAVGFGPDHRVVRMVGLADLAISFGLLRGRRPARWLVARLLANIAIGGLCARTIASGQPQRSRATAMMALLATLSILDGFAARRLR